MTEEEIVNKFRENIEGVLDENSAERVIEATLGLEQLPDGSVLTRLTAPSPSYETSLA